MRKLFQHIRRQPKNVRDNYALGIAGSFTLVVALLWVVAFPSEGLLDEPEITTEKLTPFATLLSESKKKMAAIKDAMNTASTTDTQTAAAVTATSSPESIVLTESDIAVAQEKASTTAASSTSPQPMYTEVLIGTTTDDRASSSAQNPSPATYE